MKNPTLSLAAALILTFTVGAQPVFNAPKAPQAGQQRQQSPDQKARKDASRAAQKLGLDTLQKSKWEAASLVRITANEPLKTRLRSSTEPSEKQKIRLQMKDNTNRFNESVNAFLTADQKSKWLQLQQERKAAKAGKRKNSISPADQPANNPN